MVSKLFHGTRAISLTRSLKISNYYEKLTELGCTILGGDTDSTFTVLNGLDPIFIDRELAKFYAEYTKLWNVTDNHLLMEHEKQVKSFLFVMILYLSAINASTKRELTITAII